MKSVILAGGFGTRIRPLSFSKPKALVEFCNRPLVEYQIEACKKAGIDHIILTVSQHQDIIDSIRSLGEKHSVRIDFSVESQPLGTAGSLRLAGDFIRDGVDQCEEFLVFNHDIICDYKLNDLIEYHRRKKAKATILVKRVNNPKDLGVILTDEDNKILSFLEKPEHFFSNKINAGVYVLNKDLLDLIPLRNYSIEREFFPKLIKQGTTFAFDLESYWSDVGKPNTYLEGQNLYLSHLCEVNMSQNKEENKEPLLSLSESRGSLYSEVPDSEKSFPGSLEDLEDDTNNIQGPVLIHPDAHIGDYCLIGPNVCIGPNVRVGNGCRILNSTLLSDVKVESNCFIEGSIIGWSSHIKRWTRIEGLTVLGENVKIGESLFLRGSIVLPHKILDHSIYDKDRIII